MGTPVEELIRTAPPIAAVEIPEGTRAHAELAIGGMTCASCVARIERKLGKLEGVESAGVNLATERASVGYDPARVAVPDLVRTIEAAGYTACPLEQAAPASVAVAGVARQDLALIGMTCASCVARIERTLGRLEGVESASVNLATERASVAYDPALISPPRRMPRGTARHPWRRRRPRARTRRRRAAAASRAGVAPWRSARPSPPRCWRWR